MSHSQPRALWVAGTRGEVLHLGPLYRALRLPEHDEHARHWFAVLGEQGMATYQAIDFLGLHPDEEFELRYLADDPAIRLHHLMKDIESLVRRHRATHVLFSGFGPTAAAAALVCHGRQCRGLWVRPRDPANLIPRLRWERGLEAVIKALPHSVGVAQAEGFPLAVDGVGCVDGVDSGEFKEVPNRRSGAPLIMIAVTRMLWGMQGVLNQVVCTAAEWARAAPEADWLLMRTLDPRLEGPLNSMPDRPANLLSSPPVPYNEYQRLLVECSAVLTDSCHIAAEFMDRGRAVAALGELPAETRALGEKLMHIGAADLSSEGLLTFLKKSLRESSPPPKAIHTHSNDLLSKVESWLDVPTAQWP